MKGLKGKVVIVAGSAGALGVAIARRLLDEGSRVVGVDLDAGALARAAAQLDSAALTTLPADLTSEAGAIQVVDEALARFGRIDLLANAVGVIGPTQPLATSAVKDLDAVYQVNVRGVYLIMKAVIGQLLRQGNGGAIVNVASVAALRARPGRAFYGLSKRAVVALSASAALEYAPSNIRINCVAPGPIDSPMFRAMNAGATAKVWDSSVIPMGRLGQPEEVAAFVCFLLSDDASFCTGGVYLVDGGAAL